jgi:hypothetical protein
LDGCHYLIHYFGGNEPVRAYDDQQFGHSKLFFSVENEKIKEK